MKNCPKCNYTMRTKTFKDLTSFKKIITIITYFDRAGIEEPRKWICKNCKREVIKYSEPDDLNKVMKENK